MELSLSSAFLALAYCVLLSLLCYASTVEAQSGEFDVDINAFDIFPPICAFVDPPPEGWKLWSDQATWGSTGVIPGVGPAGAGQAVTVPCGMAVILDVPTLNVTLLRISGHLKVLYNPSVPRIAIEANFVLVDGQLTIGTPDNPYNGSVSFTLTPSSSRGELTITNPPASEINPSNVGYKVFAVVGGQVTFHGMPGGSATPSWVRIVKTAKKGDRVITVDADVSAWPSGGRLAISSTDFEVRQAEEVTIANVTKGPDGWTIGFLEPLNNSHWGEPLESGHPGKLLQQSAEVALLTRHILIKGSQEQGNLTTEGGHFIIFQTQTPQYLEGVELVNMGQQGTLGRYPMHFHLVGDSRNQSYVRKLAVHNTNQRCIVVHGTHNLLVEENVAYNTSGHCFFLEDGIETGNVIHRNLGMLTLPVQKLIPSPPGAEANETDNSPATFWISNPNNTVTQNVAAGSADSGFWYELRSRVRGPSANLPGADQISPQRIPVHEFSDNLAHSNNHGLRTYPHGYFPAVKDQSDPNVQRLAPEDISFLRFYSYKNRYGGAFMHNTHNVVIKDSTFADNAIGVDLDGVIYCQVVDSLIVGETSNTGNPKNCNVNGTWPDCLPLDSCSLPMPVTPDQGGRARTKPQPWHITPIIGISYGQDFVFTPGGTNLAQGVAFAGFTSRCNIPSAAVSIGGEALNYFNPSHSTKNLTLAPGTNPFWFDPSKTFSSDRNWTAAQYYVFRDQDGSLLGNQGGYVLTNNTELLPPKGGVNCTADSTKGGYYCQGVCYRVLRVTYLEPGFNANANSTVSVNASGSSLLIRRMEDNSTVTLPGNMQGVFFNSTAFLDQTSGVWYRYFFATLAANYTYELQVVGGALGIAPLNLQLGLHDEGGCPSGLKLLLPLSEPNNQWVLKSTYQDQKGGIPFLTSCPSTSSLLDVTSYRYVCNPDKTVLSFDLAGVVNPGGMRYISVQKVNAQGGYCPGMASCGFFAGGDTWAYKDDGIQQDPPFYAKPEVTTGPSGQMLTANSWAATPDTGWGTGSAPFTTGYGNPGATLLAQTSPASMRRVVTYYFRKVFTVANPTCYTTLQLGYLAVDGMVAYLNGEEVVRVNMPDTWNKIDRPEIRNSTYANGSRGPYWNAAAIPVQGKGAYAELVGGANFLAVEVHVFQFRGLGVTFDAWLTTDYTCGGKQGY